MFRTKSSLDWISSQVTKLKIDFQKSFQGDLLEEDLDRMVQQLGFGDWISVLDTLYSLRGLSPYALQAMTEIKLTIHSIHDLEVSVVKAIEKYAGNQELTAQLAGALLSLKQGDFTTAQEIIDQLVNFDDVTNDMIE